MPELQEVDLHIALAWIMSRDHEFVLYVFKSPFAPLDDAWANFAKAEHVSDTIAMTAQAAWLRLREMVVQEKVIMRATPFEKGQHINAIGVFGQPYEVERDLYSSWQPTLVGPKDASLLVMDLCQTEIRLRPTNWFSEGGYWWRDVELDWSELFEQFKEMDEPLKVPKNIRAKQNLPKTQIAVLEAVKELWPNGEVFGIRRNVRNAVIAKTMTPLHGKVSDSTIDRAMDWLEKTKSEDV